MKRLCFLVLALTASLLFPLHAAPGDVDSLDANVVGIAVHATAVQPDGKILIAGEFTSVLGQPRNNIARLNADGTLDEGFNPGADGLVQCIAVQADGQILLGGEFTGVGGSPRNCIARVAADGTLDGAFDFYLGGIVLCIAVQADGQILLGGEFPSLGGSPRNNVARVAADGTLDEGFDPNVNGMVFSMAVQADGQILLGGAFTTVSGTTRNRIARLAADGTLDVGFSPYVNSIVSSVAVQADGQILLGGLFYFVGGTARNGIARLASNGTVDMGFNPNVIRANLPPGNLDIRFVRSIAVQADGKIVFAGSFLKVSGIPRLSIARVAADGTLDAEFNPGSLGTSSVAVQADGQILIGGGFSAANDYPRNLFARLLNDPTTRTLSAVDVTKVLWTRSGSAPEVSQTTFELSTDGGNSYTPLVGTATRMGTTADWQLTGLSLPTSGQLRARGRTTSGYGNGSSGMVEQVVSFNLSVVPTVTQVTPSTGTTEGGTNVTITGTNFSGATDVSIGGVAATSITVDSATQITATTPAHAAGAVSVEVTNSGGTNAANTFFTYLDPPTVTLSTANLLTTATTLTITGTGFDDVTPGNNSVAFTPAGTGTVTAATTTSLTVTGLSGLTLGPLNAVVTTNSLSSGAAVQVRTVVAPGPGDLDSLDANVVGTAVYATAVQPDGKILIAGSFTSVLGQPRNNIARLNADGTLDADFHPDVNGLIFCVAVKADGQILLGGQFTTVGGTLRNRIARVAPDGELDASFNPDANGPVISLAMQADGKILLGGTFTSVGGTTRNRIARVAADGTLDEGFDPNVDSQVNSVAVQADGNILLAGHFATTGGIPRNRIARVAADGTLDAGFDPNASDIISSLAVQANGQILLGGAFSAIGGVPRNRIARISSDGTLDLSFDPNLGYGSVYNVLSMAVQADGKIVFGGIFATVGGTTRNRMARVAADGTLDAGFNPNVGGGVYSVAAQADGQILIGGNFTTVGGTPRNLFVRLLNDPATQSLSAVDATQVLWTRGGSAPDVSQTTFELSTDGGSSYTSLGGTATRMGTTADWQLTGLSLPTSGQLRARGRTIGGCRNGSSGMVEQVVSFSGVVPLAPSVTLVTPASGSTAGGTSVTITGTNFTGATDVSIGGVAATSITVDSATQITATTPAHAAGAVSVEVTTPGGTNAANSFFTYLDPPTVTLSTTNLLTTATTLTITGTGFDDVTPGNNSVAFTPAGTGTVTAATPTSLTVTSVSGLTLGALNAVVTTNSLSSGAAVQVRTVVAPGPGDLDSLDANVVGSYVYATAVQPDGKILIAGNFTSVLGQPRNNIARLNADGTLDADFNPDANGLIYCVAVETDGQILLGGQFTTLGGTPRNRIARVAPDGELDASFNPNASGPVISLAMQADGKILLGGSFTSVGGTTRNRIARVAADGTLDVGFNPNVNGTVFSVAVQTNGQILLGGGFTTVGVITRNFIARMEADGTLDVSFHPNVNNHVFCVAMQRDGQILLGGKFITIGGVRRNYIARVASDGTLDVGFNANVGFFDIFNVFSVAVQADGKILLGGLFTTVGGTSRNRMARVVADGTLDAGFNPNANGSNAWVNSVAVQADGQILIGGSFTTVGGTTRNRFARLLNDPATQTLSALDATQVLWTRGGSAPEISQTTFELSTDGGSSYTPLVGTATRMGTTANWQLTGLSLPTSGQLRARGRTTSGYGNGSSGMVEQVVSFSGVVPLAPSVALVSPASGSTAGGTSVTITGTNFTGATDVTIGGVAATSITVDSATQITATTPAHAAGVVSVEVTTPGGTNAANVLFTYLQTVLTATYTNATDVPVTAASFTATGQMVNFTLSYAPTTATTLTVVRNTGLDFISGTFDNLMQGQAVALSFGGATYHFVANYYGGSGNDLVLVWAGTRVMAWGQNHGGQLGDSSTTARYLPVAANATGVLAGKTVIATAAGVAHSLALCSDGTLATWGFNGVGELGDDSGTQSSVPVAVNTAGALAGKTVIAVAAGAYHSLALCTDGTLVSWGYNGGGQLGDGSVIDRNAPVVVSTGVLAGKTVIAVSAGIFHSLALCSDGTVAAWGLNGEGELGNGSGMDSRVPVAVNTTGALMGKTVTAVMAGAYHSLALCSDGTLTAWGYNDYGQLGDGSTAPRTVPVAVSVDTALAGKTVIAAATSRYHSLALCSDGTLAGWGYNGDGELGNGTTTTSLLPTATNQSGILADRTVIAVSTGEFHSLALCSDGTLATWGVNSFGQLGDGTTTLSLLPLTVSHSSLNPGDSFVATKSGTFANYSLALVAPSALTAIQIWRQAHFGSIANSGSGENTLDFDNDGLGNLVEFSFGLNPTSGTSLQLPQAQLIGSDLVIGFTQPGSVSGIIYGAEWSTTLLPESWTPITDTGANNTHTFSAPVGANTSVFMRLRVTEP